MICWDVSTTTWDDFKDVLGRVGTTRDELGRLTLKAPTINRDSKNTRNGKQAAP